MAIGCVAAWWLMGVPGLIGWVAGAWGGMSAATPWELDEEDAGGTPGGDEWEHPRAARHSTREEERLLCVATYPRGERRAPVPLILQRCTTFAG